MSSDSPIRTLLEKLDRRTALGALGAGLLGLLGLGGCTSGEKEPPPPVEVPLADLPEGSRIRVRHGENPVELLRTADGIRARSLWCTHFGCEVRWSEEDRQYLCPCHEGIFDERGRVVSGPPPAPLTDYPIQVDGPVIRVGAAADETGSGS